MINDNEHYLNIKPRILRGLILAEEEGFEPSVVLPLRLISSQVHSTTLPPLLRFVEAVILAEPLRVFSAP